MTSSYALKQEHLWLCDWSITGYVKSKNSTLWRNLGIEFQFFSRKGWNGKWSKSCYDATGLGTCFDFLLLEIEGQQLAKVRFKMKRTKVCSFDFFFWIIQEQQLDKVLLIMQLELLWFPFRLHPKLRLIFSRNIMGTGLNVLTKMPPNHGWMN